MFKYLSKYHYLHFRIINPKENTSRDTYLLCPYQMPTRSNDHLVVFIRADGALAAPMSKADILRLFIMSRNRNTKLNAFNFSKYPTRYIVQVWPHIAFAGIPY